MTRLSRPICFSSHRPFLTYASQVLLEEFGSFWYWFCEYTTYSTYDTWCNFLIPDTLLILELHISFLVQLRVNVQCLSRNTWGQWDFGTLLEYCTHLLQSFFVSCFHLIKHLQILAHQYISHLSSCLDRCGPHMEIPYLRRNKCGPHPCRPSFARLSSCELVVLCFCSFWEKPSFGCCSFDILRTGLCRPCPRHKIISIRHPLHIFYSLSAILLYLCSQGHLRLWESSISDKCPKRRPGQGHCPSSLVNRSYCKPISLWRLISEVWRDCLDRCLPVALPRSSLGEILV